MSDLLIYIIVSAGLGALIGLIRQWDEQSDNQPGDFAGVRTHTFWAVLGCLGAFASEAHTPYAFVAVLVLVAAHLIAQAVSEADNAAPGSTSFAGAMVTMFCGALVFWDETKSAVVVAATAMVVLISGLSFAGYIAIRLVGARAGILLTGALGGLASSTASTLAFSRRSREAPKMSEHYALAVVAACTVMLPRVLIATGLVNRNFAQTLIVPFALMAVPGILYGGWVWLRRHPAHHEGDTPELGNPLSLSTAIKFAALYSAIAFLVKVIREQGWTQGMLPLAFVSGLTDMDAISLSLASDYGKEKTAADLATRAVILAAVSNTLLKTGMALMLGSTGLKWRVGIVLGATAAVGVASMFFGDALNPFRNP